ncbi:hypothetical protein SprV_0501986000 [Sparganum proliferum]
MENRSLELRQASCESAKKSYPDPTSQKRLTRLWKQTTPMSQAIIQNHLEQQIATKSSVSPLLKELTVPSFGYDSADGSMLHSLEENPQEDLLSLPPPVSTQRRFSDNPLTSKTCAYAYQAEAPAKLTYSSQHLAPQAKLQSAPVRSFCCLLHRQQNLCDRCDQPSHPSQFPAAGGPMRPHWSDSLTEMSNVYPPDWHRCTHHCADAYSGAVAAAAAAVTETGAEGNASSSHRLAGVGHRSSVEDIGAANVCQSTGYGCGPAAFSSPQTNVNHLGFDEWKPVRSGGVLQESDCVPLSSRPLSSGNFARMSTKQAGRTTCASPKRHLSRTEERMSHQLCRGHLTPSRSNSRHEEELGFVNSSPSRCVKSLECGERVNEMVQNLSETLHDILQCHALEMNAQQMYTDQALPRTGHGENAVTLDDEDSTGGHAGDRAVFTTPMSRLIPPDLIFSPASRRVSAVDINDALEASGDMRMLTVSSPRQLSRQNSIHSIEDMVQLGDTYPGGGDVSHALSPQSSLSSDRIFLKPQYAATPPELQRRFLADSSAQYYCVSHARSFDQFGRQGSYGGHQYLHSAQPSPSRVGSSARVEGRVHRAASHSPTLTQFDRQLVQRSFTHGDESERTQSPPTLHTQLGKPVHKSDVDLFGQPHLRYLRRRIDGKNRSSPIRQGFVRATQYNSEENGGSPRLLPPSEPNSSHGPTEVGSSCRTPEFFSLDSSNSDPVCQQEAERPVRESRQHGSNASPCLVREKPQSAYCLSGVDQTASQDAGGRCSGRPLDRTAAFLTTSADCLNTERTSISRLSRTHLRPAQSDHKHHCTTITVASHRDSQLPGGPKKRSRRRGDELHPRKSLEVMSAWSSSCSPSTQSTRSSSRRESLAKRLGISKAMSSEVEGRGDLGNGQYLMPVVADRRRQSKAAIEELQQQQQQLNSHFRRDYTIDAKTDQLFQAFLQHDPSLDKTCIPPCTTK